MNDISIINRQNTLLRDFHKCDNDTKNNPVIDKKNGLFIGSFDMFTNGHMDTLKQALPLFDHIYIVISTNHLKHRVYSADSCQTSIINAITRAGIDNKVSVSQSKELAVHIAEKLDCLYIIRGLRNTTDYQYESLLNVSNKELNPIINTVYFMSNCPNISSTMVREFVRYDEDVSKYLPYDYEILRKL